MTGAAGMLGRDLVPTLTGDVTAVDLDVDITRAAAVDACVADCRPERIFHLAAWTDVDGAESHEDEAFAVNADGTRNVARAAAACGADLVVVSTDYVFDGTAEAPYTEDAPRAPIGCSISAPLAAPTAKAALSGCRCGIIRLTPSME